MARRTRTWLAGGAAPIPIDADDRRLLIRAIWNGVRTRGAPAQIRCQVRNLASCGLLRRRRDRVGEWDLTASGWRALDQVAAGSTSWITSKPSN